MQLALHWLLVVAPGLAEHCAEQVALAFADPTLQQSIAEEIEAHLVGGAVGDVARVLLGAIRLLHLLLNAADFHAERFVDWPHPVGIAFGQVVVHRGQMRTFAFERGEIERQALQ